MKPKIAARLALLVTLLGAAMAGASAPGARRSAAAPAAAVQSSAFPVSTDRSSWLPWMASGDDFSGTPLDMSRFLDAPAGQHGFIRVRPNAPAGGPMLEFADGTPVRFWGLTLVQGRCFVPNDYADFVAARLASAAATSFACTRWTRTSPIPTSSTRGSVTPGTSPQPLWTCWTT